MTSPDPTRQPGHLALLFTTLRAMDDAIGELYELRGAGQVRQRFVWPMIRLAHDGPMTIVDLARSLGLTHSAVSQTVSQLREAELVTSRPATSGDRRTRVIDLTDQGRELVPLLEAEWRATEAAVAELDAELPYPLRRAAEDLAAVLRERPFADRLRHHLDAVLADRGPGPATADGPPAARR